ncbi:MAG: serine acetyltransferase [Acutalibacteraceae bacterium]
MQENQKLTGYKADFYRMTGTEYRSGISSFVKRHLFHNLQFAFYFRKYQNRKSIFRRFQLYRLSHKYGLEISPDAKIGNGLYLGHPYNITVGSDVTMGDNVNLNKGCTLGRTNRGNSGSPTIGNNVYIGINATVVGKISIGNDVMIAPNSFVNFDVPDHSIVVGNPGVIHSKNDAVEGYVCFRV